MTVIVLIIIAGAIYANGVKAIPYCLMFFLLHLEIVGIGNYCKSILKLTTDKLLSVYKKIEAKKEKETAL